MEKFELEKSTDMELVLFLIRHINEPCEDLEGNNVRGVYLMEARVLLLRLTNPSAKKMLEDEIKKYEQQG